MTPDLAAKIATAKKAGYSDGEIASFLGTSDPTLAPKIATAKAAGYNDADIIGHLSQPKGYAQAKSRITDTEAKIAAAGDRMGLGALNKTGALGGFSDQVIRNLGVSDELAGGAAYIGQGAENVLRQFQGKPIDIPASSAAKAALDNEREQQQKYAQAHPMGNALAWLGGAAAGGPAKGPVAALSPLKAGATVAALNAPFAVARQKGTLTERAAPAAAETALAFGLGSAAQAGGNALASYAAKRSASSAASPVADTVARFDQAGVSPMLATRGKGTSTMANVVAENPLAGGPARMRLRRAVEQTGASANALASKYGETRGAQITGENVQEGVTRFARDKNTSTSFAARAGAIYDDVFGKLDSAMSGKTSAPNVSAQPVASAGMDSSGQPINVLQRAASGGSQIATPNTTAVLGNITQGAQSPAISQLITDPTVSKAARFLENANAAKDMSFQDLRSMRTWVRTAQKNQELRQTIGDANLQRMEGALTQDIYQNADKLGSPALAKQLRRADQFYAAGQDRIKNALSSFTDAKSGENAYGRILQAAGSTGTADAQKLLSLKRSLAPDEWGDVASNVVSELGKPKAGVAQNGDFSVSEFVTNYNKLSPRGRAVLFGSVGGGGAKASALRKELDNLASVAGDVKNVEKGANTSKTFVNAQAAGTLTGLIVPGSREAILAGLAGMGLTGELMTNPAVIRWVANVAGGKTTAPVALSALGKLAVGNPRLAPVYAHLAEQLGVPLPNGAGPRNAPEAQSQSMTP